MKMILITTDNEISVHEFPEQESCHDANKILRNMIGTTCRIYEHVMPKRLYRELGGSNKVGREKGRCVNMLVDEEGLLKKLPVNTVGSFLYETDVHGYPIVGNILIAGEVWSGNGIDFCGMSEEQFELLYPKLELLVQKAREMK